MSSPGLHGRVILIVEDEPLIAIDLADAFVSTGAKVVTASSVKQALRVAKDTGISGAVIDYELPDGDCAQLCAALKEHNVPFVISSGVKPEHSVISDIPQLPKPADPDFVVTVLKGLISQPCYSPSTSLSRPSLKGLERN
jgi:DNA-binding response OmpR family regulator